MMETGLRISAYVCFYKFRSQKIKPKMDLDLDFQPTEIYANTPYQSEPLI